MKALFVINERSGRRRDYDIAKLIRSTAKIDFELLGCDRKDDLDAIIDRAEADGVDVVFAVGGDGTVHETAKRLIGRAPALGILPIGSGNGFARHIGLSMDLTVCLESVESSHVVTIDTALVNDSPFLGVMGVGFDAEIADRFATSTTRGLESYVREGLNALRFLHAEEYEIVAEGHTIRTKALVVAVANSGQYGNNARIAPLASLQDGLLDVVIIHDASIVAAPILLARLFSGTIHEASSVTTLQTRELTIRRPAGPAHLDGEPVSLPDELRVRVVPSSLRLLVPATTLKL